MNLTRWFFFILTALTLGAHAQTQNAFQPGVEFVINAEQKLISRDLDTSRIVSPNTNNQDPTYKAENGTVFEVKSYWIEASDAHGFFAETLSTKERTLWQRTVNGKTQWRFLVHPESESFYADFLKNHHVEAADSFLATATSSSRTLLMWPQGHKEEAFFGKLSLNKEIAGFSRTIPLSETVRSVGVTNILESERKNTPSNFKYLPEVYSVIPKGMDRGGMIIRKIPRAVAEGKELILPAFSLYAQKSDTERPLLAQLIKDSGMTAEQFVRTKIIRPFVKQWLTLENNFGITMEPHAQNFMIGLTSDLKLTGNFYHRDFGGFNMDLAYRARLKRPLPPLPTVRGVERDYHQVSEDKEYRLSLPKGLIKFFSAGFLYNLDQKIPTWKQHGWIPNSDPVNFELMLTDELILALRKASKGKIAVSDRSGKEWRRQDLFEQIQKLRDIIHPEAAMTSLRCSKIFSNN